MPERGQTIVFNVEGADRRSSAEFQMRLEIESERIEQLLGELYR